MWSARKFVWVFWTLNFVIGLAFSLTAAFNGKSIDALYAKVADGDRTTNNLIGGLIGTSAWGVVLCALFALFSFVVLLRKAIAMTGAGFSYGLVVGSCFHMFFALSEVSVSLIAHDEWLKNLPEHQWGKSSQNLYMTVYYLGFISASSFLILAVVMIICMKALLPDEVAEKKDEMDSFGRPLSMFRDRYGVSSSSSGA